MGSEIIRQVAELAQKDHERRQNELIERHKQFFIEVATASYDKATVYTTVVIAAGYAGFFAIWGWVNDYMERWEILTTALLIGFSLLAFICWEVYVMYLMSKRNLVDATLITAPNPNFEQLAESARNMAHQDALHLMRRWPVVFWVTTIPGLLGGVLLLYAAARLLLSVSSAGGSGVVGLA